MKDCSPVKTVLRKGFLQDKQELNRHVTIKAVYERFAETGRIRAFDFAWREGEPFKPHIFWDSDVAKWMEGAAYILRKHPDAKLQKRVEDIIDRIEAHQCADGYFNIYFTNVEPSRRFFDRNCHELYCAGHLIEAAVAYAEATGRERFLNAMKKYADYIRKVFLEEKSARFQTPGHEEIELALVRLYRYTGERKYLELAAFFIDRRGVADEEHLDYNQSHLPVREQSEAVGHAVRAVYLYTAMADLAYELRDAKLKSACRRLFRSITEQKMYVTGGIGSCYLGEDFSKPFDLPNAEAYTETCAGIGLIFFCDRMMRLENSAVYADVIERVLYNGVMSGLSLDGKRFFYENPLEITLQDHFANSRGEKRYPITQRPKFFGCSCCPPNLNRLLPDLEKYLFGRDGSTLYINQFASAALDEDGVRAETQTDYPNSGEVRIRVSGCRKVAVRMPGWCEGFKMSVPFEKRGGYAVAEVPQAGLDFSVDMDISPFAVCSGHEVTRDAGLVCIQAGPIVYCAESVDNCENLHAIRISPDFSWKAEYEPKFGLNRLEIGAFRLLGGKTLYSRAKDEKEEAFSLKLIPYCCFANRGETDMLVWFRRK